jgi:ATP-dependent RNA helicase RhlE
MQHSYRPAKRGFNQRGGGSRSAAPRSFNSRAEYYRRPQRSRGPQQSNIDPAKLVRKASGEVKVEVYTPKHQFSDFPFDDRIQANLASRGYTAPTPIQDQAIPHVLEGKDVVGIANTGTGKTAAFLLPLLHKLSKVPNQYVLIILPTRELANQVDAEFRLFAQNTRAHSTICVGGMSIGRQIADLRRNPQFVIGTPGRLKDLVQRRALDLTKFNNVVLDEVDRMLDMGFVRDIKTLVSYLPANKQSLFFSATINNEAQTIMGSLLKNPVTVSVKTGETSVNIDQDIVRVISKDKKIDQLHDLLNSDGFTKVLIFGHTKRGVEKLSNSLEQRGFKVSSLHGDKSQSQRQRALDQFKTNRTTILVATDVAARGLDIPDVSHVINYEMPNTYADYVHRIGRTGRAAKKGFALTFVD